MHRFNWYEVYPVCRAAKIEIIIQEQKALHFFDFVLLVPIKPSNSTILYYHN